MPWTCTAPAPLGCGWVLAQLDLGGLVGVDIREQGLGGGQDLRGGQLTGTDRGEHILDAVELYPVGQALVVDAGQRQALELPLQQLAAGVDVFVPGLGAEPVLDLGPRASVFR